MKISILFVGALNDRGFNQRALEGAERMRDGADAEIEIVSGIPYEASAMTEALHAAAAGSDGLVFIGGQGNAVTPPVASEYPDCSFAVVQGNVTGPNLASYDVLQEQSAFLAGALAARLTRSGTVAHLSGHRVVPGLKGRAAFSAGVGHTDADVRLLTGFCGTQDDSTITETWARAMADEGADILFTMLNAARDGATRACRATGMRQIGNAADWCLVDPETFVASAVARIDLGVELAVTDLLSRTRPADVRHLGLAEKAVGLTFAPDVGDTIRDEIDRLASDIAAGAVFVETTYDGPEFEVRP